MSDERERLSQTEALRLWQRAAQLQADAARRDEAWPGREEEVPGTAVRRHEEDGYALVQVRAAALEAGISEEYLEAALAELVAERAMASTSPPGRQRVSDWVLGHPPDAVEARRVVRADVPTVLAAMEEVLPKDPFGLLLRERIGEPAEGGTLVFDIQGVGFTVSGAGFKGDASFADLRQVFATLRPLPGEPPSTELVLRAPVAWARRLNAVLLGGLSGLGGLLGLLAGVAVGLGLSFVGPVVAGVAAATGLVGGARLSLGGFRMLHRYGLEKGTKALEAVAATVAAKAEGGWGFLPKP